MAELVNAAEVTDATEAGAPCCEDNATASATATATAVEEASQSSSKKGKKKKTKAQAPATPSKAAPEGEAATEATTPEGSKAAPEDDAAPVPEPEGETAPASPATVVDVAAVLRAKGIGARGGGGSKKKAPKAAGATSAAVAAAKAAAAARPTQKKGGKKFSNGPTGDSAFNKSPGNCGTNNCC